MCHPCRSDGGDSYDPKARENALLRRQFTSSKVSSLLSSRKVLTLPLTVDRKTFDMVSLSVLATSTASLMLPAQPWAMCVSTYGSSHTRCTLASTIMAMRFHMHSPYTVCYGGLVLAIFLYTAHFLSSCGTTRHLSPYPDDDVHTIKIQGCQVARKLSRLKEIDCIPLPVYRIPWRSI